MCLMAVPNEHTFPHLATLGDCSIKTALRWLKTKHWIGKYIGMHPGMSLALATFTNHSPKLPYLSNCITLVKIFFWKHRVNFVHYVLLPTEQAETYLKIYYLTHILRRVVKKKPLADRGGTPPLNGKKVVFDGLPNCTIFLCSLDVGNMIK